MEEDFRYEPAQFRWHDPSQPNPPEDAHRWNRDNALHIFQVLQSNATLAVRCVQDNRLSASDHPGDLNLSEQKLIYVILLSLEEQIAKAHDYTPWFPTWAQAARERLRDAVKRLVSDQAIGKPIPDTEVEELQWCAGRLSEALAESALAHGGATKGKCIGRPPVWQPVVEAFKRALLTDPGLTPDEFLPTYNRRHANEGKRELSGFKKALGYRNRQSAKRRPVGAGKNAQRKPAKTPKTHNR